jgi:hypothetical protein
MLTKHYLKPLIYSPGMYFARLSLEVSPGIRYLVCISENVSKLETENV